MSRNSKAPPKESKICVCCGRVIEARKKWEKNWDQVKYCSEKCRRTKIPTHLENDILLLLKERGANKTLCPSEVLPLDQRQDKSKMEEVRQAARRLVTEGKIVITQNGNVVDPSTAKGPIRLKLF